MPDDETIESLTPRYVAGIAWIQEHDPEGAFYFWYMSGIRPHHPLPSQTDERREEYRVWVRAYELWLRLDRKLLRLERQAAAAAQEGVPA